MSDKTEKWEADEFRVYMGDGGISLHAVPNGVERARLIAAAPDGLALAEAVIAAVDGACTVERDHPQADLADVLRAAWALRAKATGA